MPMLHVVVIAGTRPEAIKLAPLVLALRRQRRIRTTLLCTGQHAHLVKPILGFFGLRTEANLALMQPDQTLSGFASRAIDRLSRRLESLAPDWVVVQGDTTTAMCAALAAFHQRIPVAHLEAGLRTNELYSPFPEEINRRIISQIASLHWAPTPAAARTLRRERLPLRGGRVLVTGNTVIDALLAGVALLRRRPRRDRLGARVLRHKTASPDNRLVLITGHRRENFGEPLKQICAALMAVAAADPKTLFVYPLHPNPSVKGPVSRLLGGHPNIVLAPPQDYPAFLQLLLLADVIVTDSGGVQEEAPALGKTVLVTRTCTERPEGLRTGLVRLVGHRSRPLIQALRTTLALRRRRQKAPAPAFVYGDGRAAERCVASLLGRPVKPFRPAK